MTEQPPQTHFSPKLIHVAMIWPRGQPCMYVLLRQLAPYHFVWFLEEKAGFEKETTAWGGTAQEALCVAYKVWKKDNIRTLNCGFRYTLPERDEVGTNALFHQMVSSYSSSSGIYFDEELGSNCIVQLASLEARHLYNRLK